MSDLAAATLRHRPGDAGEVVARAARRRRHARRSAASSPTPSPRPARCSPPGPVTVVLGRANVAESADGVVAAAAAIHAAHPAGAVPLRAAPGQRARRPRHGPGARPAARPRHARRRRRRGSRAAAGRRCPASAGLDAAGHPRRPPPTARSTCSSCSAPTRSPTSPTATSPRRALAGARTVIAVDRFLTASAQQADVVLAAAGSPRPTARPPTSRAGSAPSARKVTPPGTARADWMIAAELAACLGADLGLESAGADLGGDRRGRAEPRRPHRRRHPRRAATASSSVAPSTTGGPRRRARGHAPRPDGPRHGPDAGVEADAADAADGGRRRRRPGGAAGRRGRGHRGPGRRRDADADATAAAARPARRRCSRFARPATDRAAGRRRLLAAPRRQPRSSTTTAPSSQHSPALAGLAGDTVLRLNPHDFDRLGVAAGSDGHASPRRRARSTLPVQRRRRASAAARPPSSLNQPGADRRRAHRRHRAGHRRSGWRRRDARARRRPAPRRRHRPRRGRSSSCFKVADHASRCCSSRCCS